jgi:hypothetical protein
MDKREVIDRVCQLDPASLKPHSLSLKIYGQPGVGINQALSDSIQEVGVIVPLVVTSDHVIVAGHSRWYLATGFKHKTVPCFVHPFQDDLEVQAAVIHSNRQREKTELQRHREYGELLRIERARAKERQGKRHDLDNIQVNSSESSQRGQAADIAAKAVGLSRQTAERGQEVIKAIDEAEAGGDSGRGEQLRQALNGKSVKCAYELATGTTTKPMPTIMSPPEPELRGSPRAAIVDVPSAAEAYRLSEGMTVQLQQVYSLYAAMDPYGQAAFLELAQQNMKPVAARRKAL